MINSKMSLEGKRVIVIGGASGIGFAIAELSRELGAQVVIASRNAVRIKAAVARLNGASGLTVDLRDEASVSRLFKGIGLFDHLAITAGDWGGAMFGATRELDLNTARDGLEVRFWGVLAAAKHASGAIAPDGSITLTSGMLAHRPRKGAPVAAAIGGAIEHLTQGLAVDLAPVRINAVCPGFVLTEHVTQMPQEALKAYVAGLPVPRAALPAEAAAAYVYLMLNGYATGQVVPVDGGGLLV
ncbi:MAG TPA: SDR family oxidoreductase [Acidocella sp.]|jgi:NAD(P)-dependent dehydrogenase (short-subunit alcohol dehydrogenase family)|nr:SDR family oxidoreductase [Acidocella sp.]